MTPIEVWSTDDGWRVEIYSKEPLETSFGPGEEQYSKLVLSLLAKGYKLENKNETN